MNSPVEHYVGSVLNPDKSLAVVPTWWIYEILAMEKSNGILLNFSQVEANRVPVGAPASTTLSCLHKESPAIGRFAFPTAMANIKIADRIR